MPHASASCPRLLPSSTSLARGPPHASSRCLPAWLAWPPAFGVGPDLSHNLTLARRAAARHVPVPVQVSRVHEDARRPVITSARNCRRWPLRPHGPLASLERSLGRSEASGGTVGLLPPAPTRRMFSLPHGSGTRPRMPCASTAARGTWSGCASSTWWPRTTATCRSRPCTAAGATIWAYRSATGSGLGSRCTIGPRHLAMRRCRPRELWRLSASQGGWTAGAWVFGMCMGAWILWGNARQRPSWLADARFPLDTRLCSAHRAYCRLHVNLFTRVQYPGQFGKLFVYRK